jgi:transposase
MDAELWAEIRRLHLRERWAKKRIARHLKVDRNTVRSALAMAKFDDKRGPATRTSKLDPYKEQVRGILREHGDLSVVRIHEEIRRLGFSGGDTILREFVHSIRPPVDKEVYLRIAFPPGDAAQVDWGCCGKILVDGVPRRLSAFVFVLCASR